MDIQLNVYRRENSQFDIYTGNVQGVRDYERMMFFCQGLAMGLELGVRACN